MPQYVAVLGHAQIRAPPGEQQRDLVARAEWDGMRRPQPALLYTHPKLANPTRPDAKEVDLNNVGDLELRDLLVPVTRGQSATQTSPPGEPVLWAPVVATRQSGCPPPANALHAPVVVVVVVGR